MKIRKRTFYNLFAKIIVISVPSSKLFSIAWILSHILSYPARWINFPRIECPFSNDIRTSILRSMLIYITHNGGRFKLNVNNSSIDEIKDAYACKRRVILCSVHFPLNRIMYRVLHDKGIPITVLKAGQRDPVPKGWIWGAEGEINFVSLSQFVLLHIKKKLSQGYAVVMLLDTLEKRGNVPLYQKTGRQFYVSPSIFSFASRTQTPVFLFCGSMVNGKLSLITKKLLLGRDNEEADIDNGINNFISFVNDQMNDKTLVL